MDYFITCKLFVHLDGDSVLRLFGLKAIMLRLVINICLTTVIWFIAPIKYDGEYTLTVFTFLHFVKMFVWENSVFTWYSYYCDLFCLGPASRLCDCHLHRWGSYIDNTKITITFNFWSITTITATKFMLSNQATTERWQSQIRNTGPKQKKSQK